MAKIAEVNKKGRSEILVSGHTDDKPLTFGSIYRDNWDLARKIFICSSRIVKHRKVTT